MLRIKKYLKPFLPWVFVALAFLFGQAMCDLKLPDLMSGIVNTGLQQGGIDNAAPDAISPEGFAMMLCYMEPEAKELAAALYERRAANDLDRSGTPCVVRYPAMGDFVYVRIDTAPAIDKAFGDAAYNFLAKARDLAAAASDPNESNPANEANAMGQTIDLKMMYAAHAMIQMSAGAEGGAGGENAFGESFARQAGAMMAKAFYEELGVDTYAIQLRYIVKIGAQMLLITFLGGISSVLVGLLAPRIAAGAARNLRKDLFAKVESFSHHEFDKFSSASLITRCTNDVQQVQMLVGMGIRMMCFAPIMGIGGTIMALRKSVSMSWIIALAVIVLIGVVIILISISTPRFKIIQKLIDRLNLVTRETLGGLMVIRAFGTQGHERGRFDKANAELTKTNLFVQRAMAFSFPMITLIMNGVTLLIVWVGANMIAESAMQVGDMLAFMQYSMQIIMSFMMMAMMFVFIPRAAVSGERIAEVLETEITISDPPEPLAFEKGVSGLVEFKDVGFRYQNAEADALSGITFTAKPGQTTAIIGATGSGKSTVANLLMRFYDVTEGCIMVDGVDIRKVRQADLRAKTGYVPQKGTLLAGTIRSNINYGAPDASAADTEAAAEIAQALDFIEERPERYDSEITQDATNVSGGQKQRLSIARALAKDPEILIFDDSFSALDFKTDANLRKALAKRTGDKTVIVVAQRVGTIMGADQIIVLDEGRIAGIGKHGQLLETCPAYNEIATSQLTDGTRQGVDDGKEVAR
ncbi:MAG: ABC transporter ATP-binding protein/permease [Defluviitaleaceae bacterium]|nr:ABC transporter ATP-binding protein/permease [Defluviitaleaceae bacterium]